MKRKRIIRFIIIWFLIIFGFGIGGLYLAKPMLDDEITDAYSKNKLTAVIVKSRLGDDVEVTNSSEFLGGIKGFQLNRKLAFEQLCMDESYNVFLLVSYTDEDSNTMAYNLIKFDEKLSAVAETGWFVYNWTGTIADMDVCEGVIYMVQTSNKDLIYEYQQKESELVDSKGFKRTPKIEELPTFYADKTHKLEDGKVLKDAYVDEDQVVIVSTTDELDTPMQKTLKIALENKKAMISTPKYFFKKHLFEIIVLAFVFILGIAVYILFPKFLAERNRFAVMLIIWEICLVVALTLLWFVSNYAVDVFVFMALFVVASIIGIVLLWTQGNDLRELSEAVNKMVEQGLIPEKPEVYGKDVRYIWNGIIELGSKFEKNKRAAKLVYDAMDRFYPKGISLISKQSNVVELKTGNLTSSNMPIAIIKGEFLRENKIDGQLATDENSLAYKYIKFISKYQNFKQGALVGITNDLSEAEFVFTNESRGLHNFMLDFYNQVGKQAIGTKDKNATIVIHCCNVNYGILGTNIFLQQYMYSSEARELKAQLPQLMRIGVEYAITKEALDKDKDKATVRYIGKFEFESRQKPLEIYQVLDNFSQSKKMQYLNNLELFEKAMELLAQHNFYLARNTFAEELKNVPEDGVARYYIYICEKNLEENADEVSITLNI